MEDAQLEFVNKTFKRRKFNMKRYGKLITVSLGLFIGVLVLTSAQAKQIQDVNVVNTPNINISNKVDNPLPVGDVQNPAFQPFEVDKHIGVNNGTAMLSAVIPPAGSAGQRAVIEHVTVDARVPDGQNIVVRIGQPDEIEHSLVLTSQGIWGSAHRYTASQPIRLYSVGGGDGLIFAIIERSSSGGSATVYVTISGHLVDLP
jgi:hypothetical protein